MKRVLLILCLLLPTAVYADSISINCSKTSVNPGENITCNVVGNTNGSISSLKAVIKTSGLELVGVTTNTALWQGDGNGGVFDLYTDTNKTGSFSIGTITLKAGNSPGTVGFSEAVYYSADFEEVAVTKNGVTISLKESENKPISTPVTEPVKPSTGVTTPTSEKSANTFLKELIIDDVDISFSKDKLEYEFEVSNEINALNIKATPEDSKAKVDIKGHESLIDGQNNIVIKVVAENGDVKEYKLLVTRLESTNEDINTYLSSIIIDGYRLDFNKVVLNYNLEIGNETSLQIRCTPEDENAKVEIEGNNDLKNKSVIKIKVSTEDGNQKVYSITVIKKMDNRIKMIIIALLSFIIGVIFGLCLKKLIKVMRHRRSL